MKNLAERIGPTPFDKLHAPVKPCGPFEVYDPVRNQCVSKLGCWGKCVLSSITGAPPFGPVFNPIAYGMCVVKCKKKAPKKAPKKKALRKVSKKQASKKKATKKRLKKKSAR